MGHDNGYACACAPGYTDYNCLGEISVEVEGLSSDNTGEHDIISLLTPLVNPIFQMKGLLYI